MRSGNNPKSEPKSHHLITYKDSFLYPIKRNGSTHKLRISLQGLFYLVPSPTNSPQNENLSVKMVKFTGKDLGI